MPPPGATVTTPFSTATTGIADGDRSIFRVRDIDNMIRELNLEDGSFFKILSMIAQEEPATQIRYEWGEDDIPSNSTLVTVTATAAAATLTVADSRQLIQNSKVMVASTGELILLGAAPTNATTIGTLTRGAFGTAAQAIPLNDSLIFLGDMLPELGSANLGGGQVPSERFNFVTLYSKGFRSSRLQENSVMIENVGQVPRETIRKMVEMKRQINADLIFGKRGKLLSFGSDGIVYSSDGFVNVVKSNELNLEGGNGALSWPTLNHFLNQVGDATSSSPTKALFAGQALFSAITRISYNRISRPFMFEEAIGATVGQIMTDRGMMVDVINDRQAFPSVSTTLSGMGIVVDMAHVRLKTKSGFELQWRTNIQDPDSHVIQNELFGSASLKLMLEETHGVIRGAVEQF